jgi:GxxExxY protein
MNVDQDNLLSGAVIGAAIKVHRELGPGHEEPVYQAAMELQLQWDGVAFRAQPPLPLIYKGVHLNCGYRPDFILSNRLVAELKSVEVWHPIYEAQLITYLRLTGIELGLLLNFDVPVLKEGIRRRVLSSSQTEFPSRAPLPATRPMDPLSTEIIAAAVEVHRELGPGLLASAYEESLCHECFLRRLPFQRKQTLPLRLGETTLLHRLEIPLLVCDQIPVVALSLLELTPLHEARLLSCLRQANLPFGLIINFNVNSLTHGIRRIINPNFKKDRP